MYSWNKQVYRGNEFLKVSLEFETEDFVSVMDLRQTQLKSVVAMELCPVLFFKNNFFYPIKTSFEVRIIITILFFFPRKKAKQLYFVPSFLP